MRLDCRTIIEYRTSRRVKDQFDTSGFGELIPHDLVNVFDEREVELLIGGMSEIDVDDWFWKYIQSWPAEFKFVFYSSPLERPGYRSMASKTCKALMDCVVSRLRKLVTFAITKESYLFQPH